VTHGQTGDPGEVRTKATRRGNAPVFVDTTGRRRRLLTVLGAGGSVVLLLVALVLLAGFTGVAPGGLPGWPGSDGGRAQGAGPTPRPADTPSSSGAGKLTAAPTARPSLGTGPTFPPTATAPAPTATADPTPTANPKPTHGPSGHPSRKP
jgi:hypothetical protein